MAEQSDLLIPFAAGSAGGCRAATETLALPNLARLLSRMQSGATDAGNEDSLSLPHDRALARAAGLPDQDGLIPWAAWERRETADGPCAFITPCHWRIGMDHATMADPAALQLGAEESNALLAAMQPFFAEDGIALEFNRPDRWFARSELFRHLRAASLDRVIGRNLNHWMPDSDAGRPLRRLQSEMQMLLYTHPVNDERAGRGLLPINSFWVHGAGALPTGFVPAPTLPTVSQALREPALREDWGAWAAAWQSIDATECAALADALERGQNVRLTLCGERSAVTFEPAPRSLGRRLSSLLRKTPVAQTLLAL